MLAHSVVLHKKIPTLKRRYPLLFIGVFCCLLRNLATVIGLNDPICIGTARFCRPAYYRYATLRLKVLEARFELCDSPGMQGSIVKPNYIAIIVSTT